MSVTAEEVAAVRKPLRRELDAAQARIAELEAMLAAIAELPSVFEDCATGSQTFSAMVARGCAEKLRAVLNGEARP